MGVRPAGVLVNKALRKYDCFWTVRDSVLKRGDSAGKVECRVSLLVEFECLG